jgi:hypothetical protein
MNKLEKGAVFVVELGKIGDEEIGMACVVETGMRRREWRRKMGRMGATVANIRVEEGEFGGRIWDVWTRKQTEEECAKVRTMYKKKAKKVNPVNTPLPDGIKPEGGPLDWAGNIHAGKIVPRGSRLTPERIAVMNIGGGTLRDAEVQLVRDLLFKHEGVFAFDDSEMGILDPAIEPPVKIHTVPHQPWQQQNLRLPKSMQDAATAIVKEKLANGTLEASQGPYRSRYFLVAKKEPGTWRFINDVQPLNKVTIRDAGMPPAVDQFSEEFAGYPISSSIDFYAGYYQILLDLASRDLTAFLTELGLVRMTRLPMGWTNSVACFQRVMIKVLWRWLEYAKPFLDDVAIRGPKEKDEMEVLPGIRKYVWEHVEILDGVLGDIWRSGMTISGKKTAFAMPGIAIVGMICDYDGRHPDQRKVQKILDWPTPRSTKDARGFIGICVYYRMFIFEFSIIAAPIIRLFKKSVRFVWGEEQQAAMDNLKRMLTEAPVLITLDFSPGAGKIILNVDAAMTIGWGAALHQEQPDGTRRPARFDGGLWNDAERKYDAGMLECRGLLKALKKLRFWLYGRHFIVEMDARNLIWLLNQPPNDLPSAMITRWLTYIRLFDFDVHHIAGKKNGAADALSRRGRAPEDSDTEDDVDDFFDAKLYNITVGGGRKLTARVWLVEGEYDGDDLRIGRYLETLERPGGISDVDFKVLKRKAAMFMVRDGYLFKRPQRNGPPRRVVGTQEQRLEILQQLHDQTGHRGRKATFEHISRRYQWKGMFEDVSNYVKTCEKCQLRKKNRFEEPLHPTWSTYVWQKIGLDVVYMPVTKDGYGFLVLARDDLSGWIEGRALKERNSLEVASFIYEDIICRHGLPRKIVMDNGKENLDLTKSLLENYQIKNINISDFHPQSNGLVERGHSPLVNALSKYARDRQNDWVRYLPLAMWADRVTIRQSTGYSAFRLLYGQDCLLPVDFTVVSWSMIDWEELREREELLEARMRQLDEREVAEARAAAELEHSRRVNKDYFDRAKQLRPDHLRLQIGDLVLLFNSARETMRMRRAKLDDNWFGPYRIWEVSESGYYRLEEMDGTRLNQSFAGNRLMKFFPRDAARGQERVGQSFETMPEPEEVSSDSEMDEEEA